MTNQEQLLHQYPDAERVTEPARVLPVIGEYDIVVLGGGCTGVCAALRAARLGARTAIVEQTNAFGGVATNGFVCVWHALTDTTFRKQIISGVTEEVIERLKRIPNGITIKMPPDLDTALFRDPVYSFYHLNTEEMKIELDTMLLEAGVTPYLHTRYSAPYTVNGELCGVIIENRSGRAVLRGKYFVDATADGYLGADMGMEVYYHESIQPATCGARVWGWDKLDHPNRKLRTEESRKRIGGRAGWDDLVPGAPDVRTWFKSQFAEDCSRADILTRGEINGRAQIREMMNILREQDPHGNELSLLALGGMLGIRETRQLRCAYQLKTDDVAYGRTFDDAIAYCAYPVDIHTPQKATVIRYLDGVEKHGGPDGQKIYGRWRDDEGPYPTYWSIPYRSILPREIPNLLICGRALDAEKGAHGASRVMISLNQTGEAAGVAAFEALDSGKSVQNISFPSMRKKMQQGGSIVL